MFGCIVFFKVTSNYVQKNPSQQKFLNRSSQFSKTEILKQIMPFLINERVGAFKKRGNETIRLRLIKEKGGFKKLKLIARSFHGAASQLFRNIRFKRSLTFIGQDLYFFDFIYKQRVQKLIEKSKKRICFFICLIRFFIGFGQLLIFFFGELSPNRIYFSHWGGGKCAKEMKCLLKSKKIIPGSFFNLSEDLIYF